MDLAEELAAPPDPPVAAAPPPPPPVGLIKTEIVDARVTDFILHRLSVGDFPEGRQPSPDDLGLLKAAVRKWKKAGGRVAYKLGRHGDAGRFSAIGGAGLQCFRREVRALLAAPHYWDVDMKNAQPVLLEQVCRKRGWACPTLAAYVARRDEVLATAAAAMACDRDEAKAAVNAIVFGCSREAVAARGLPPFFTSLWDELRWVRDRLYDALARTALRLSVDRAAARDGKDPRTSLAANVLQTLERKCLVAMDAALAARGRTLATYIHDGGLVAKLPDEAEFPADLLRHCEAAIEAATSYKVTLAVKPLESAIVVRDFGEEDLAGGYADVKRRFEDCEGASKIIEKALFSQRTAEGVQLVTQDALRVSYCDWTYRARRPRDGTWEVADVAFLPRWLLDGGKRAWRSVSFWPSHAPRAGVLNTFDGFAYERLLCDETVGDAPAESVALLHELAENVTGGFSERLWDLVAFMLQRPARRTGVCVVLRGESGVGKDTLLTFIGSLFGKRMYANIKDAARDVFGQFNGLMREAVFVHLEEANSAVFMDAKLAEMFKALITSGNVPINQKHREQVDGHTYANFFLSTNRDIAVKLEADDRRFWLLQSRATSKGDSAYWARVHAALAQPSLAKALAKALLARDLAGFCPSASRPATALLDITRRKNIELPIRFLNEVAFEEACARSDGDCSSLDIDSDGHVVVAARALHARFCEWARAQELQHVLPLQAFSDKLKICGVLGADAPLVHCRRRFRGGVASSAVSAYTIRLAALRQWLRAKRLVTDSANDEDLGFDVVSAPDGGDAAAAL
jgi:hypothetical protein